MPPDAAVADPPSETTPSTAASETPPEGTSPPAGAGGGTAEGAGEGGAGGDETTARSLETLLGSESLSEDDFRELTERSEALRRHVEGRETRARQNAERKREAELRRQAKTATGQQSMAKAVLASAGLDAAAQEKALPGLLTMADKVREAQLVETTDHVINTIGGQDLELTREEREQIELATDTEGQVRTDVAVKVFVKAAARQELLQADAAQVLEKHPTSAFARGIDRLVKSRVAAELEAQGVARAAASEGAPNTPTGGTTPDPVALWENMTDEQLAELDPDKRREAFNAYYERVRPAS